MKSELKVHTRTGPVRQVPAEKAAPKWKSVAHPAGGIRAKWKASAPGEKLLRHTSIACALLLGVMTLHNADLPWTRQAVAGIEQAMTMQIDLDETLGKLHFVRELVPETALVFWNSSSSLEGIAPVDGEILHEYSDLQPWRVYSCDENASVYCALPGTVLQTEEGAMAQKLVLVEHAGGLSSVYAYLEDVHVQVGQSVSAGEVIGTASGQMYFAAMRDGEQIDPALLR